MVDGSQVLYLEQVSSFNFTLCITFYCICNVNLLSSGILENSSKPFRQVCFLHLMMVSSCLNEYLWTGSLIIIFLFGLQRLYMVKPCPKELKCDVEVRI